MWKNFPIATDTEYICLPEPIKYIIETLTDRENRKELFNKCFYAHILCIMIVLVYKTFDLPTHVYYYGGRKGFKIA